MDTKLICKNMEVNEVDLNTVTKKYRNPKMKNTVKYISMQEVPQLKKNFQQDQGIFMVEINGKQCSKLADYLKIMSDSFSFPIEAKGVDGYNDWMRDLTWIEEKKIAVIISNYTDFLKDDLSSKEVILQEFNQLILPWWDGEYAGCLVNGDELKKGHDDLLCYIKSCQIK